VWRLQPLTPAGPEIHATASKGRLPKSMAVVIVEVLRQPFAEKGGDLACDLIEQWTQAGRQPPTEDTAPVGQGQSARICCAVRRVIRAHLTVRPRRAEPDS